MPSIPFHLRVATLLAFITLSNVPVYAAPTVASQDFASSPVATPVNISVAIPAVTPGPVSLSLRYSIDFSLGACTPNGAGCSAAVTFDPTKPGLRQDALIVKDGNGRVVEEVFLHGIGVGAVPVFSPAAATVALCPGLTCSAPTYASSGIAAEPNGRILMINSAGNAISEFNPKTGNLTTITSVPTGNLFPVVQRIAVDAAGNIYYGDYDYDNPSALGIHRIDAATGADAVVVSGPGIGGGVGTGDFVIAATGTIYYVVSDQIFAADPNSYAVTLIAGNGKQGYGGDNGRAVNAELTYPSGLVLDNSGNLYFADSGTGRIRKIDCTATITTIAGTGVNANSGDGGLAINAALNSPSSLAIDAAGDLYVSASGAIRRIDSGTGLISTIAGAAFSGNFPGVGSAASAEQLLGGLLAIDPDGNLWSLGVDLYEIFPSAYPVRFPFAIAAQSSVQTVSLLNAGNASFSQPTINLSGAGSTDFSTASNCAPEITPGTACQINITFVAGSDATPQATLTLAGSVWSSSQIIPISGASGGLSPATKQLSTVEVGSSSATPQVVNVQFAGNASGLTVALAYGIEFSIGQPSCSGTGAVSCNIAVTFKPLYPGLRQDAIQFLDAKGNVIYQCFLSATGLGPQWFSSVYQIGSTNQPANTSLTAIDAAGNLYAVPANNLGPGIVYRFTKSTGQWTIVAGQATTGFDSGDGGPATNATFAFVTSAAVDPAGNLYIGDGSAIRRVDARTGIITTVAQQGGSLVTVDGHGYVYFYTDFKVYRLDPSTGLITTYAGNGQGSATGNGDNGPATAATLGYVEALAFDASGNLFISSQNPLRRVDASSGIITTYAQTGSSSMSFDAAGDLLVPCSYCGAPLAFVIVPPGGAPPYGQVGSSGLVGPVLRDPSGTFYTSDGKILGTKLAPTYSLPSAAVGGSPTQATIPLMNSGNEALPFNAISLGGANAAEFSQSNTCGQSLSPAQSCAINLTFAPVQIGAATATLNVSSTLPPLQTTVSSTGMVGVLQFNPSSLNFGTVPSSATDENYVTMFNSGSVPVTISGISISGPNASDFTETWSCPPVLAPTAGNCLVFVTFQAGALGMRTASLNITSNAAGSPQTIPLTAFVSAPAPNVGYLAYWGVNNTGVTVSWSTDVPANTQLAYGTTTALGQLSPLQTTLANSHGVVLTGLNPGTTYYFVAQSTGANGATGHSTTYSFTTSGTPITVSAPIITGVAGTNVTATSATITWTTDQASSSLVNYGTTTSYGSSSTLDATLVTSHSVTLTGLTAGVTYNFDVVSANSANLSATSANATFTTTAPSSGPAPYVGYVAYWGVNNTGVTISWSTDVPASTQLAYGITTALGQLSPLQTTLANSHGVVLTNLNPGTAYYFVAQSTAANGVTGYSTTYNFTTSGTPATPSAPAISGVTAANVSGTSATITWTTDQASSSLVNYGASSSYGSSSTLDSTLVTSHSLTLTGLTAGVTYNFDVVSANAANLSATSGNFTFTTTAASSGSAPSVGYVGYWGVNDTSVTVSWSTDVPANTQ